MDNMEEYKIPDEAIEKLKDPEVLRRQMDEGKTFQEIIGYSPDTMEKFYRAAYNLFQQQEYQKAADAFIFLTTLNPNTNSYWLGLGMAEQLCGGYQGALLAYAMAILTDVENPTAHYHSASCYRVLRDYESAVQSLDMAVKCAHDKPQYSHLKEQALAAKVAIEKKKSK